MPYPNVTHSRISLTSREQFAELGLNELTEASISKLYHDSEIKPEMNQDAIDSFLQAAVLKDVARLSVFEEQGTVWKVIKGEEAKGEDVNKYYKLNKNGTRTLIGGVNELKAEIRRFFGSENLAKFYWRHCYQGVFFGAPYIKWYEYFSKKEILFFKHQKSKKDRDDGFTDRPIFKKESKGIISFQETTDFIITSPEADHAALAGNSAPPNASIFTKLLLTETSNHDVEVKIERNELSIFSLPAQELFYKNESIPSELQPQGVTPQGKAQEIAKRRLLLHPTQQHLKRILVRILTEHYIAKGENKIQANQIAVMQFQTLAETHDHRGFITNTKLKAILEWLEKTEQVEQLQISDKNRKQLSSLKRILQLHCAYSTKQKPEASHLSTREYLDKLYTLAKEFRPSIWERLWSWLFIPTQRYMLYKSTLNTAKQYEKYWRVAKSADLEKLKDEITQLEGVQQDGAGRNTDGYVAESQKNLIRKYLKRISILLKLHSSSKSVSKKLFAVAESDYQKINGLLEPDSKKILRGLEEVKQRLAKLENEKLNIKQYLEHNFYEREYIRLYQMFYIEPVTLEDLQEQIKHAEINLKLVELCLKYITEIGRNADNKVLHSEIRNKQGLISNRFLAGLVDRLLVTKADQPHDLVEIQFQLQAFCDSIKREKIDNLQKEKYLCYREHYDFLWKMMREAEDIQQIIKEINERKQSYVTFSNSLFDHSGSILKQISADRQFNLQKVKFDTINKILENVNLHQNEIVQLIQVENEINLAKQRQAELMCNLEQQLESEKTPAPVMKILYEEVIESPRKTYSTSKSRALDNMREYILSGKVASSAIRKKNNVVGQDAVEPDGVVPPIPQIKKTNSPSL